jgi:hypothetical protein
MEEFSVFKARRQAGESNSGRRSLFVPHIPLFDNSKHNSVADLIALNERYYDAEKQSIAIRSRITNEDARSPIGSMSKTNIQANYSDTPKCHVRESNCTNNAFGDQKHEYVPLDFKRKRIKDIDLRFTNTGLMSYCDYLRGSQV